MTDQLLDRVLQGSPAPSAPSGPDPLLDRLLAPAGPAVTPDRRTGAPANVRAAVGSASTPADRLATMQRFYPDARPEGTDNFIFTDPRSGRPTLYNPPGLDMGDAASIIPEAGEFLGGIVGGALAAPVAIGGAPVTGGASVLAVPAGVGLGAAAGREIATMGANAFGGTVDTRGAGTRVADAATTAGVNAVAGPVMEGAVSGLRRLLGPVQRIVGGTGRASPQDFLRAGVRASAGDVTGNPGTQMAQVALGSTPGAARRMGAFMEGQTDDLGRAVTQTAEQIGVPSTAQAAGGTIREGANAAVQRFTDRSAQIYDDAFARIGADSRVQFPAVQQLQQRLMAEIQRAPNSAAPRLQPVLDRVNALLADAGPDGLAFGAMRSERTALGRELGAPSVSASAPRADRVQAFQQLYGAMSEDMATHARQAGPDAAQALTLADRYTRFNRTVNLPVLERIQRQGTDEQVFNLAFPRSGRPDAQMLGRITRQLTPEERSTLSATVLDRMGTPNPGSQAGEDFSAATFMTNWNRLNQNGPAARRLLFGREDAPLGEALDRLGRVAGAIRDTQRYTNWSGTARTGTAVAAAGLIGNEAMQGDVGGMVGAVGLSLVAPAAAARLLTNPAFVNWLAGAAPTIAAQEVGPGLLRSLTRIGAVNPQIREAVDEYRGLITSRQRQQ